MSEHADNQHIERKTARDEVAVQALLPLPFVKCFPFGSLAIPPIRSIASALCSSVEGHSAQGHLDSCNRVWLVSQRDTGTKHLFMLLPVVHLAERSCQFWIVISACRVMVLDTEHAWRNSDALALPLFLP